MIDLIPENYRKRYLSYFDLLGIKAYHEESSWINLFEIYANAIKSALRDLKSEKILIKKLWFSDSFLFITEDDSKESFLSIELFARVFMYKCLSRQVPLRGALSFGEVYFDEINNMVFGKPLIEAIKCGEKQDWIGYIITKSAEEKISEFLKLPSLNYASENILFKDKSQNQAKHNEEVYFAYIIGEHIKTNGKNRIIDILKAMSAVIKDKEIQSKYIRTINFIEKNRRDF